MRANAQLRPRIRQDLRPDVGEYIALAGRRPWAWGEHDCTLFAAGWALSARGVDLAVGFRGSYATAEECRALLKREGGLVALVSRAAAAHGLSPTDAPGAGDVGVVRGAIEWRGRVLRPPTAAVCVGPARWALLTEARGVAIADLPVLSAWSV